MILKFNKTMVQINLYFFYDIVDRPKTMFISCSHNTYNYIKCWGGCWHIFWYI